MADMGPSTWQPPKPGEEYVAVSKYADQYQLRRDLPEPLPPPSLASQFRQELLEAPFHRVADLAAEWGMAAITLHDPSVQEVLEAIEDGDEELVNSRRNPAPE